MRARTVPAAIALAGTVLLGGAAQALADDNDGMGNVGGTSSAGGEFGNTSHGSSDPGQGMSPGKGSSGFGQVGSIFDRTDAR
ncbi:hypothetical protein ABT288_02205 [Streptomyces sp. NPDC001093]|uniref:hypothetical protein n=1 Tax=Streptomyces sp. NPDC001093 TaxID=3154376 RepID=UPI003330A118